jgi:hypothetical protein
MHAPDRGPGETGAAKMKPKLVRTMNGETKVFESRHAIWLDEEVHGVSYPKCTQEVYSTGRVINHFHYADAHTSPTQPRTDCKDAIEASGIVK